MKKNILVLGVGGNVSHGILKALSKSKFDLNIIGACISYESIGLYFCDSYCISPYANSENFIPWLIETCHEKKIDFIFSGVEEIILEIQKKISLIENQTESKFISSSTEKLFIGQNKFHTVKWLEQNDCNFPQYALSNDKEAIDGLLLKIGFPLIAKPIRGKGSKGVFFIENSEQLSKVVSLDDYILQECIGTVDTEYTVGCYVTKQGRILRPIIMKRELQSGTTVKAQIVDNSFIELEAIKICKKFKPIGPMNIQLRLDKENKPVCFELNVRFSGTTPIRAHFGFNDVEAMLSEYLFDEKLEDFNFRYGTAYRYLNEVYFEQNNHQDKWNDDLKDLFSVESYGFRNK